MKTHIQLLCVCFAMCFFNHSFAASHLAISKNGVVKHVFHEDHLISVKLLDRERKNGVLTILSDSSLVVGIDTVFTSDIYSIAVKDGSEIGQAASIAGLIGGTALMGFGASLMNEEGLIGMLTGFPGLAMLSTGGVIDLISIIALVHSGKKWVVVGHEYAYHELEVFLAN